MILGLLASATSHAYTPEQICGSVRDDDEKSLERICMAVIRRDQASCRRIDAESYPRHRLFCEVTFPFVRDAEVQACQGLALDASSRGRRLGMTDRQVIDDIRDRVLFCKALAGRDSRMCVRAPTSEERRACMVMVEALQLVDASDPSKPRAEDKLMAGIDVPMPPRSWTATERAHVKLFTEQMAPDADDYRAIRLSDNLAKKVTTAFSLRVGPGGANRASASARWIADDMASFLNEEEDGLIDGESARLAFRDVEQLARLADVGDYLRDATYGIDDPWARSAALTVTRMFAETLARELFTTGRLALPTGFTQDDMGHATATLFRSSGRGGTAASFNAGAGGVEMSGGPSGPGIQLAILRLLADLRCEPPRLALGPEMAFSEEHWTQENIQTLILDLLSDKILGTRDSRPEESARRWMATRGGEARDTPYSTKPQTAGNCTHKSPMNMLKEGMDPRDYFKFKAHMRQRRLDAYRDSLPEDQRDSDELLTAAVKKHAEWLAKEREE
jgi:hypothetical protein